MHFAQSVRYPDSFHSVRTQIRSPSRGEGTYFVCGAHCKELIHLFTYSLIHFNIVIQRAKTEESHGHEIFRYAQDDKGFSLSQEKGIKLKLQKYSKQIFY